MKDNPETAKKNLAIILARKNSKRLKNKHLILVQGKPVIQYTFEYAKESPVLDDIVCSTDCEDIQKLAGICGIDVIKRPAELAADESHVIDAIEYTLKEYHRQKGELPEITVILFGNVPYRKAMIGRGIELLYEKNADSVFTACNVAKYHPDWMFGSDANRMVFKQESTNYRCQDLPDYYIDTGGFIVSKTRALLNRRERTSLYSDFGDNVYFLEENRDDTIDIDDIDDLDYFRYLLSREGQETQLDYWKG